MDAIRLFPDVFDDPLLNGLPDHLFDDVDFNELDTFDLKLSPIPFYVNTPFDADDDTNGLRSVQNQDKLSPLTADLRSNETLINGAAHSMDNEGETKHRNSLPILVTSNQKENLPMVNVTQTAQRVNRFPNNSASVSDSGLSRSTDDEDLFSNSILLSSLRQPPVIFNGSGVALQPDQQQQQQQQQQQEQQRKQQYHQQSKLMPENQCAATFSSRTTRSDKRIPHNAIERRYRASINGKIDELRALLFPFPHHEDKISKATVLRQAVSHIRELELKLERANAELKHLRSLHANSTGSLGDSTESAISSFEPSPSYLDVGDTGSLTPPFTKHISNSHLLNNIIQCCTNTVDEGLSIDTPPSDKVQIIDPSAIFQYNTNPISHPMSFSSGTEVVSTIQTNTVESFTPLPTVTELLKTSPNNQVCYSGGLVSNQLGQLGKRQASAADVQPVKTRRQLLISNKSPESKLAPLLMVNHRSALASPKPVTQCPTVRQLLSTGYISGATDNYCSSSQPITPSPLPTALTEPTTGTNNVLGSGTSFGGMAARTTLCVSALCLVALDPANLVKDRSLSSGFKTDGSSSSRRLQSGLPFIGPSLYPARFFNPGNDWLIWFIYAIQWFVALLLCWWACQKKSRLTNCDRTECKVSASVGENTISIWNHAQSAMEKESWSVAQTHLLRCLSDMNEPLRNPTSVHWTRRFVTQLGMCIDVVYLTLFRLPYCLWTLSRRRHPSSKAASTVTTKLSLPSSVEVRLSLLESMLSQSSVSAESSSLPTTLNRWSVYKLFLTCCHDFADGIGKAFPLRFWHKPTTITPSQAATVYPIHLIPRQSVVLGVALHQIVGFAFVSRMLVNIGSDVVRLFPTSPYSVWERLLLDPTVVRTLTDGPPILNRPIAFKPCSIFCPSIGSSVTHLVLTELTQRLFNNCFDLVLHGNQSKLSEMECHMAALLGLSSVDAYVDDLKKSPGQSGQWWIRMLSVMWRYRLQNVAENTNAGCDSGISTSPGSLNFGTSSALPLVEPPPVSLTNSNSYIESISRALWLAYQAISACDSKYMELAAVTRAHQSFTLLKKFTHVTLINLDETDMDQELQFVCKLPVYQLFAANWSLTAIANCLPSLKRNDLSSENVTSSFMQGLISLRQFVNCLDDQPPWLSLKLAYFESVGHMILGTNPVQTRLTLLCKCESLNQQSTPARKRKQSSQQSVTSVFRNLSFLKSTDSVSAAKSVPDETTETVLSASTKLTTTDYPSLAPHRYHNLTQSPGL